MTAVGWLARRELTRRWSVTVPLALVVAVGLGGALLAVESAVRTSTAYSRYLQRAEVGDLLINPSLHSSEIDEVIRSLPGVRQVTSSALFFTAVGEDWQEVRYSELPREEGFEGVFGSVDGRFATMDRLAYTDGRPPTGTGEAVVSVDLAAAQGLGVGDPVTVSFWSVQDELRAMFLDEDPLMTPVGVEELRVVGIATFPSEVLPDGLYPRGRMVVSPDVAARYDCLPSEPPAEAVDPEAAVTMIPASSATSYRYWSLDVEGGDSGVAAAQEAFIREGTSRNAELARALVDLDARYILIATTTAQERERVDRAIQPTVAGLAVLGGAVTLITVALFGLSAARALRRRRDDQEHWWQLGLDLRGRALVGVAPLAAALVVGTLAALALCWWWSPLGPVATVRAVEPDPGRSLTAGTWLLAAGAFAALVVLAFALAWHTARSPSRRPTLRPSAMSRLPIGRASRPEVAEGLRAAWGSGRGAGLVVASGAVAAVVLTASLVFASSLTRLLDTPAWYGWPWQAAILGGYGYGGLDQAAVTAALDDDADVDRWVGLGFWQSLTVEGVALPSLVAYEGSSALDLALTAGRLPVAPDEVALGARFAAEHAFRVGDQVELDGDGVAIEQATVTGLVVLPSLGPLESDRATPGYGMLLPASALAPELAAGLFSFVGLDLEDRADPATVAAGFAEDFRAWDFYGYPLSYSAPVRPAEIVNVQSMRVVPVLVAVLVTMAAIVGLAASLIASVGARRRDLVILRALGCTRAQIRTSVVVQSVASVAVALVIGIPLGVVVGRVAWRSFAGQLGVVTTPSVSLVWLVAVVAGAAVVAVVAAAAPARRAGAAPVTTLQRD